jgi:DNA-binding IclR family transcriptional regulator
LELLNSLAQSPEGLAVAELHRRVGLDMATIGRLLATLESYGYVTQLPEERKYRIGPAGLRMAQPSLRQELLRAAAAPELRFLRDECRETSALFIREGFSRLCVDQLESPEQLRTATDMGRSYPVTSGSTGILLMAFAQPAVCEMLLRQAPLESITEATVTDRAVLARMVQQAREDGYSLSEDQQAVGLAALAAPVLGADGLALAAIAITGPTSRWTRERRLAFVETLREACDRISAKLEKAAAVTAFA